MAMDNDKLHAFVGKALGDFGAALGAALVIVGDKLGLYKAMAGAGPMTASELAAKTGTNERYVREWLASQAAAGYIEYDAAGAVFHMTEEQAFVLANPDSPVFMPGGYDVVTATIHDEPRLAAAFKSGDGVGWHEHHACLFRGTERFFRPNYLNNLVSSWIPSLDGVQSKLERGARVADIGCGHGSSTILMAQSFPNSEFIGFDYHPPSIETAKQRAAVAGVGERIKFEVAPAKEYPGSGYDFVAFFDCLHDMGDPAGASKHVYDTLLPDGTWMIVEPFAGDRLEDNLNPVGRLMYAASAQICVPASRAQEGALGLGAQAGQMRLETVIREGGFTRIRRATETPFNMILEARK